MPRTSKRMTRPTSSTVDHSKERLGGGIWTKVVKGCGGEGGEGGRCWGIYEGDKFWGGRAQLIDLMLSIQGYGTIYNVNTCYFADC